MLDVHAPHSPLHGTKEFFFHLFTITVGLLIATQIESCVEWRHHVHLAEEARASLRVEIQKNFDDLKAAEPGLQSWRNEVQADLDALARIQAHPNDKAVQRASISVSAHGITLSNTAWKTAESSGALAYMPYAEAQRYAQIYQAQEHLLAIQELPIDDMAHVIGLVSKFSDTRTLTPQQAGELAEPLGQVAFLLADGSMVMKQNIELNQAFLEVREPQGDFTEKLK